MANASKAKGDRAELEVQGFIREELGFPARRALGAGRKDDVGDIANVPRTVIQVVSTKDIARAVREKPLEAEEQRKRAGATFAVTAVRLRGGEYRYVLTPSQWATYAREVL